MVFYILLSLVCFAGGEDVDRERDHLQENSASAQHAISVLESSSSSRAGVATVAPLVVQGPRKKKETKNRRAAKIDEGPVKGKRRLTAFPPESEEELPRDIFRAPSKSSRVSESYPLDLPESIDIECVMRFAPGTVQCDSSDIGIQTDPSTQTPEECTKEIIQDPQGWMACLECIRYCNSQLNWVCGRSSASVTFIPKLCMSFVHAIRRPTPFRVARSFLSSVVMAALCVDAVGVEFSDCGAGLRVMYTRFFGAEHPSELDQLRQRVSEMEGLLVLLQRNVTTLSNRL